MNKPTLAIGTELENLKSFFVIISRYIHGQFTLGGTRTLIC
jgi:hypothetical protein